MPHPNYHNHLNKQDALTRRQEGEMSSHFAALNMLMIIKVFGNILSFALPLALTMINIELYYMHAIASFLFIRGLLLLLSENRDELLRLSIVLLISGGVFFVTELIGYHYLALLLLGIPATCIIQSRSYKYMILPTIMFTSIFLTLLVLYTEYYLISWFALLPLILFYYLTRHKVKAKPTYYGELSAYAKRKQKEQEQKNL